MISSTSLPIATFSNASDDIFKKVQNRFLYYVIGSKCDVFAKSIGDKIEITKLLYDTFSNNAIVECRIMVDDDMVNQDRTLHTGCAAYLLDMITALPFVLLSSVSDAKTSSKYAMAPFAPSRSLDITYTSSAPIRSTLKIAAKCIASIDRTLYVRGEIWEMDNNCLVAYASHVKKMPRKPPLAAVKLGLKL